MILKIQKGGRSNGYQYIECTRFEYELFEVRIWDEGKGIYTLFHRPTDQRIENAHAEWQNIQTESITDALNNGPEHNGFPVVMRFIIQVKAGDNGAEKERCLDTNTRVFVMENGRTVDTIYPTSI